MVQTDLQAALKHKYRLPSGTPVVSVTAISGLLDIGGKSSAFAGAAVKLTKQGVDYRAEWRAKAERGTRVHTYCEAFLRGEPAEVAEGDGGFVDALEKWMVAERPVMRAQECIVLSDTGYGGRLDLLATINGEEWLIDVKGGKPYPIEHTLQLAAYRYADGVAIYDEAGALKSIDSPPLRRIERAGCLYLREDGTYSMTPYPADHDAFLTFRQLLDAHRWATSDAMKALEKEARK
jgi:hypothetical protein